MLPSGEQAWLIIDYRLARRALHDPRLVKGPGGTSMAFLILVAGHETTVNLIGNGMLALLTHPEQCELLCFDGPVQVTTPRRIAAPVDVGGVTVPGDEIVLISVLAANHDPVCTAEADILDITRVDNPHPTLGHGIRHCLGAPLARLEGRIALVPCSAASAAPAGGARRAADLPTRRADERPHRAARDPALTTKRCRPSAAERTGFGQP